ncbi:hypothetical protein Tco_0232381 [Tanacetum coccineum]
MLSKYSLVFRLLKPHLIIISFCDKGKPLTKIDSLGDHDSDDQIASVDNDMTNFLVSKMVVYGTNSLLEQWKESYANDDYDFDPYDDDMFKGQDIPDKIQDICDNLDIKVRDRTIPVTSESISQIFVLLLSRLELEGLKWNLAAYIRKVLPLVFLSLSRLNTVKIDAVTCSTG